MVGKRNAVLVVVWIQQALNLNVVAFAGMLVLVTSVANRIVVVEALFQGCAPAFFTDVVVDAADRGFLESTCQN